MPTTEETLRAALDRERIAHSMRVEEIESENLTLRKENSRLRAELKELRMESESRMDKERRNLIEAMKSKSQPKEKA